MHGTCTGTRAGSALFSSPVPIKHYDLICICSTLGRDSRFHDRQPRDACIMFSHGRISITVNCLRVRRLRWSRKRIVHDALIVCNDNKLSLTHFPILVRWMDTFVFFNAFVLGYITLYCLRIVFDTLFYTLRCCAQTLSV